jgi:hypothetical protein
MAIPSCSWLATTGFFDYQWASWRFDLHTRTKWRFIDSQGNRPLTYSPDGRTLLYGSGDIWIADSSGANARPLLSDSAINMEAFRTPATPP